MGTEFVKKGALGYKAVPGMASDPECTHAIMEIDDYNRIINERDMARIQAASTVRQAEKDVENAKYRLQNQANSAIRQAKEDAEKYKTAWKDTERQLEEQRALNENLLRISRERANAERKLKPKKEHTGYVVVSSTERKARYRHGRADKEIVVWETVLQSPYSVDFPEEQARNLMEDLFKKDENDRWLIRRIGINGRYFEGLQALKDEGEEWEEYNTAYERNIRANYKAGYWEIIIKHTKPLDVVPKEMRAN